MSWFEDLTGIKEKSGDHIRKRLTVKNEYLVNRSLISRKWRHGRLEIVSLFNLRDQTKEIHREEPSSVTQLVANVKRLIADPNNRDSIFQVASQFNLLEMTSPHITPEMGVGRYEDDLTQGPACSIACGAGTIYRNYFIPINGQVGQTRGIQINTFEDIATYFGVNFKYSNGYIDASEPALREVNDILQQMSASNRDHLKSLLKVGIHWNTSCTLPGSKHSVNQVFCSAIPVSYSNESSSLWEPLARLVLEAAYEATLRAALLNAELTSNNKVYLTLVGGGSFGNDGDWIEDGFLAAYKNLQQGGDLDICFVSYNNANEVVDRIIERSLS